MYQELLSEVEAAQAKYGGRMQPPCSGEQLARLRESVRRGLQAELPEAYAALLRRTDGLNWNGLFIYASEETAIVGAPDASIPGFAEMNVLYRDDEWFDDLLVFGEGNMDLYVRRISTGEYQVIDRVPGNVIETLPSFERLLAAAIEAHL